MSPRADGDAARHRRVRRRIAAALVASVAVGLALWAFVVEPSRLVVKHVDLALPRWKNTHDGLRVALLADLHVGSPHWGLDALRGLVDRTNDERPDLVLLAGDYVIDGVPLGTRTAPEPIAEELGRLRAPLGVVAVLGNHDWWNDGERMRRALTERGIVVLENEARQFVHEGSTFSVVGLADPWTRDCQLREALQHVAPGEPVLVLVHGPDVFAEVEARVSLTVAGHTHGGQVRLPFLGRPIVPSSYGQRFAAGHVVEEGRHLFVTTGVGTSVLPVRFGVPPELVVLTLRAESLEAGR